MNAWLWTGLMLAFASFVIHNYYTAKSLADRARETARSLEESRRHSAEMEKRYLDLLEATLQQERSEAR